ncbi:hypothetical protein SCA6_000389 [Theobroma cacao]
MNLSTNSHLTAHDITRISSSSRHCPIISVDKPFRYRGRPDGFHQKMTKNRAAQIIRPLDSRMISDDTYL